MELATSLEGNARLILAYLSPDQQLNFEALVGKLTQRFEPEGQLGIYQSQLQSRRWKTYYTQPSNVMIPTKFCDDQWENGSLMPILLITI